MTLTRRLVLTVTGAVALAAVAVAAMLGLLARNALIAQAENQAQLIAGVIAEEANRIEVASADLELVIRDQMEAQAFALGELADAAGAAPTPLAVRFAEVAALSGLDGVWLIGPGGVAAAWTVGRQSGGGEGEGPPAELNPALVAALLSGERLSVYAGGGEGASGWRIAGVRLDGGRALIVRRAASFLDRMEDSTGLSAFIDGLVSDAIVALRVLDDSLVEIAAAGATGDVSGQGQLAAAAIDGGRPVSHLSDRVLLVAAPVADRSGIAVGAAVAALSRTPLDALFGAYLRYGLLAGGAAFLLGAALAAVAARRIARPVEAIALAAEEVEARSFQPATLNALSARNDELGRLARVFRKMAIEVQAREEILEAQVRERTIDLASKNALLEEARARTDAELAVAKRLQAAILPQDLPPAPGYAGKAAMLPAREMGGDFYDAFPLSGGRIGLVIADVSGKGVAAAFFMAISRTILQGAARDNAEPGAAIASANTLLCAENPLDLFVTAFYGVYEPSTGALAYANAGHNPPLLVRAGGAVERLPTTGGVALGVMPGLAYAEARAALAPGDILFLFTDGVTEAMDPGGNEFGEARLEETLAERRGAPADIAIDAVIGSVAQFAAGAAQSDDITCLALRRDPAAPG